MVEAKPAGPSSYIEISHVCEGCVLHREHTESPDIVGVSTTDTGGSMETVLDVSSLNGDIRRTSFSLPGVLIRDKLVEMFNSPAPGPVDDGVLACNAICAAIVNRERENQDG